MSLIPPGEGQSHPVAQPPAAFILRPLHADDDHRIALFGPMLISVWLRTEIEALQTMEKCIEEAAPAAPHGRLGLFVIVEPNATAPSPAARDELSRIRRATSIGLTALVYEGDGFGAALVRGITTSLNLLERGKTRTHIFATVPSAAQWVQSSAAEYGGGEPLEAAVRALRASSR